MPTTRGITCSLKIEGQDSHVPEYGLQAGEDFASSFVIAEEGRRFSLEVVNTAWIHSDWCLFVYIDGVYQDGGLCNGLLPGTFMAEMIFDCKHELAEGNSGIDFQKGWKFDKLSVVDESAADCQKDPRVLSNLGTIEVVVTRCWPSRNHPQQPAQPLIAPHQLAKPYWKLFAEDQKHIIKEPLRPQALFEKDIKGRGVSHCVTTEPEKQVIRKSRSSAHFLDSFDHPYCIAVMYYRSRASLQNMGLIPFTPVSSPSAGRSASPEVTQEDLEQMKKLSREEMMQELLKYRKLEAAESERKVKHEREVDGEASRSSKRVRKGPYRKDMVIIDLTDE